MQKRFFCLLLATIVLGCKTFTQDDHQMLAVNAGTTGDFEWKSVSYDQTPTVTRIEWLKDLPDNWPISRVSLPGSHDTLSLGGGDAVRTQTMDLWNQLLAGIRVFDLRVSNQNDLQICHGIAEQGYFLKNDAIAVIHKFLGEHPKEFVVARIAQDKACTDSRQSKEKIRKLDADATNVHASFYFNINQVFSQFPNLLWKGDQFKLPTLGQLRGKLLVIQAYRADTGMRDHGLVYFGCTNKICLDSWFKAQDKYELKTNWDLYGKWENVKDFLNRANADGGTNLFINHLSGSTGALPYFVASGTSSPGGPWLRTGKTEDLARKGEWPDFPRCDCTPGICSICFKGINDLAAEYLEIKDPSGKPQIKSTGILMMDFPGPRLIRNIIDSNFWRTKKD